MPTADLRIIVDGQGRRKFVVDYHSDQDALPIEHEEEHAALLGKLGLGERPKARTASIPIAAETPHEQQETQRGMVKQ